MHRKRERSLVSLPLLIRTAVHWIRIPFFWPHLYINFLPKGLISKYSPIEGLWLQHMNLGGHNSVCNRIFALAVFLCLKCSSSRFLHGLLLHFTQVWGLPWPSPTILLSSLCFSISLPLPFVILFPASNPYLILHYVTICLFPLWIPGGRDFVLCYIPRP